MKEMVLNPSMQPQPADLVAFNHVTLKPLRFTRGFTKEDLSTFNAKRKDMKFFAISGQHSTLAAKSICDYAKKDPNLAKLAEKLSKRESRILCDMTPTTLLLELSRCSNAMNKLSTFKVTIS